MVPEVAILDVRPGLTHDFEAAFTLPQAIISSMKGSVSHQSQKCLDKPNRYILMVGWESLEDHSHGFRGSPEYQEWRRPLHHFYDALAEVEQYEVVASG